MKTKFKIGETARILGISPDLLRYYEKKGIVSPEKDAVNGYRYYDFWDINVLMDCLWFKNFGFSLEQIADIVRIPSMHELDALLQVAKWLKENANGIHIRVNTNGLADLIAGGPTEARFKGLVDTVSISLNTPDPEEYLALCRPKFGTAAYPAMLHFAEEIKKFVPDVVMTIVGEPVTSPEKQAACRAICDRLGVRLRIRPYEPL